MTDDTNKTPETPGESPGNEDIKKRVVAALKTCYDPEIPVDIYELGLIYGVDVSDTDAVSITMTLTSPNCPVAETLPMDVERKVAAVDGVAAVQVDITWDPPWTPDMMSEAARLELNL
jgi:FeS assembly SUF system protein